LICALLARDGVHADEIHDAIRFNDLKAVKAVVHSDPDAVDSRGDDGMTPLHVAVGCSDAEIVTFLIAEGADVNARSINEFTPLHFAADAEIARILLRNGADPKLRSSSGTVLDNAVRDENVEVIDVLLKAGQNLTFEQLVELGRTDEVAGMLKEWPWLAKAPRKCLHTAAQKGHVEIARLLLDSGADPNLDFGYRNISGTFSPLSSAVLAGHYDVARLLCERGAKMNVSGGKSYDNLFHQTVATREIRFVNLMLDHGADVNSQKHHWGELTPLHLAANIGDAEKCKLLVHYNADVNARTPDGATPLTFAAAGGHSTVCDLLLSNRAELDIHIASALGKTADVRRMLAGNSSLANDRDERLHRTPLFWAAARGHLDVVELLIRNKADVRVGAPRYAQAGNVVTGPRVWDVDLENKAAETPLHLAAAGGHIAVVRVLLREGADVDGLDTTGDTPLLRAVANERAETVKLLLDKNAKIEVESVSALSKACDNLEVIDLLLSHNPSPRALDEALRRAAGRNREVVERLLAKGARADIHTACILGQSDRVAELTDADLSLVDEPQRDYPRERPLTLAAGHGHAKVADLLLGRGAEIGLKEDTPPLVAAAGNGRLEIVKLLLSRGADTNQRASMGRTPLHAAASAGHRAVVTLLIERGAHVLATDRNRRTALHAAACAGDVEIVRVLIAAGTPVDFRDGLGETALHEAADHGRADVAALLLIAGANVNLKDRRGKTPLFYAERTPDPIFHHDDPDHEPVVSLLRDRGGVK
jgi:ankyrin repeat protein